MSSESAGHGGSCGVLVTTLEFVPSFWGPLQFATERSDHQTTMRSYGASVQVDDSHCGDMVKSCVWGSGGFLGDLDAVLEGDSSDDVG